MSRDIPDHLFRTDADSNAVICEWCRALEEAFGLAKGARLNELHGKTVRRFDDRGMDPFSECWGRISLAESLEPTLRAVATTPWELRSQAKDAAWTEVVQEIREKDAA